MNEIIAQENQVIVDKLAILEAVLARGGELEDFNNLGLYADAILELVQDEAYKSAMSDSAGARLLVENYNANYMRIHSGTVINISEIGKPILLEKTATTNNMTWYGFYIKIPYSNIDELDRNFLFNLKLISGEKYTNINILTDLGDWNPVRHPITLNLEEFEKGIVNLKEKIQESEYADDYIATDNLYILISKYIGDADIVAQTESTWSVLPYFETDGLVLASHATSATNATNATNAGIKAFIDLEDMRVYDFMRGVSKDTSSERVTITKQQTSDSGLWVGFHTKFYYNSIDDLDYILNMNFKRVDGVKADSFKLIKNTSDWNPANFPITLTEEEVSNGFNVKEKIQESEYADDYVNLNEFVMLIANYTGDVELTNAMEFKWEVLPHVATDGLVIANGLTPELQQQIEDKSFDKKIICWGDSLTAMGGWTQRLEDLSGLIVKNGGTGGENSKTISARAGGDIMIINNISIPSDTISVLISDRDVDNGILTQFGNRVTPLLQGGTTHVNPVKINGILGNLTWTGTDYADMNGDWTFTRLEAGTEVIINRPTAITTYFDREVVEYSDIQILYIGQNGGWGTVEELIQQHKHIIEHSKARETVILGLSSGTADERLEYETAFKAEFGRYFISLREYLSNPIYDVDNNIISCYGLDDLSLTATQDDLDAIALGKTPPQLLIDSVHYTEDTRVAIGDMLYKKMIELGALEQL